MIQNSHIAYAFQGHIMDPATPSLPVPYIFSPQEWQEMYPKEEYIKKTEHACTHALHYLLALGQSDALIIGNIQETLKNERIVTRLIKQDFNHHGLTPLIIATMRGRIKVVEVLLNAGKTWNQLAKNIELRDSFSWTASHHAALCSTPIFTLLQQHGASMKARTCFQGTPLDMQRLVAKNIAPLHLDRVFFEDPLSKVTYPLSTLGQKRLYECTGLQTYSENSFLHPSKYSAL